MHSALHRLDLNLLLIFDALYRQRSVTAAAVEVAMSASAFSHAVARLRAALDDELFVRQGNRMQPTLRAEQLALPVASALKVLQDSLSHGPSFDPATSERMFVLSATDYTAFAILPALMARLQRVAPKVCLRVQYSSQRVAIEEMAAGQVDFALSYSEGRTVLPPGLEELDWLADEYVVIASAQHPRLAGALTLDGYLRERHVVVTPWNESQGSIDTVLTALSLRREVALYLPSVLVAPFVIANGELLMTMPRHAASILQQAAPIVQYAPPFAIPPYVVKVYCHSNYLSTEAHRWMREELLQLRRTLQPF